MSHNFRWNSPRATKCPLQAVPYKPDCVYFKITHSLVNFDDHCGIYADSYEDFKDVLEPIILEYHWLTADFSEAKGLFRHTWSRNIQLRVFVFVAVASTCKGSEQIKYNIMIKKTSWALQQN